MEHLTRLSLDYPKTTLGILLVITIVLGAGLPKVRPEFGYRVLIGDDHPAVQQLDAFIERFGGGLPIQIAWECGPGFPCQNVFDEQSMGMAHAITSTLRAEEGVNSVLGPSNAPLLVPTADGFAVRRFIENEQLAPDASDLAKLAVDDPLWRGALVGRDGLAASIVVQPVDSSQHTSVRVSEAVERTIESFSQSGFRFYLTGDPIQNLIVGRDLAESTSRLIPFTVLVIGIILFGLSRSVHSVTVALLTMGVGLAWTFGLLGWLEWPQDGILEVLAPLVLVVGVCDSVHLLSRYQAANHVGSEGSARSREHLIAAAKHLAGPCLITTFTTAAAFLSFVTSDLATFIRFGSIAAFGVVACLLLTFTLLPLLAFLLPDRSKKSPAMTRSWDVALGSILRSSKRRAVPLLMASSCLLLFCAWGWWAHLRVDHEWKESLGEKSEVVRSWRFMEEKIGRSDTLEVEVVLPEGSQMEDPENLKSISAFSDFLGTLENLWEPRSIVDVVERVNRLLNENDTEFERIGDSTAANAEILELIGFDDPGLLATWVNFDRTRVRISVGAPEQAFSTRERVLDAITDYAIENLPSDWQVVPTGRVAMQFAWIKDVQQTQIRSFPTALILVLLMTSVFLRSARLGLAAMVPTVLPIVVTLGAMGWVGMTLDVGRAMIAAILLGIGVDDSIHILSRYRERRELGDRPDDAIRNALLHTGRAVITTSVALALGFLTLMASAWQSISSFGFFVAIAILGALAASLFVLPALIFVFTSDRADSPEVPERGDSRRRRARTSTIAVLAPLSAVAIASVAMAILDERQTTSQCWILPKGHILTLPGSSCSLQLLDQIRWVEKKPGERHALKSAREIAQALSAPDSTIRVGILRRGTERVVSLPLIENTPLRRAARVAVAAVIAGSLMILPVLLLLHSRSRAALPLAIFYSSTGVILVAALGGQPSSAVNVAAILALVVAPAAVVQIGMVFPTESAVVRHAPGLYHAPYAMSALLGIIALFALDRTPLLWPTFVYLILLVSGTAWLALLTSCAFAVRESPSPASRSRAGFVVVASLGLPAVITIPLGWGSGPAEMTATYLWASALLIPVTIGFAIGRFNLFDVGLHVRRASARVVYFISSAFLVSTLVYVGTTVTGHPESGSDFGLLFLLAFGCLAATEALRRPLFGFLEAALSPRTEELRALRDRCTAEMANLRSEHEICRLSLKVLMDGVQLRSGWVSLQHSGAWEAAESVGRMRPPSHAATSAADRIVARTAVVYLETEPSSADRSRLIEDGISVVARMTHGDERIGLILLDADDSRPALSGFELDFAGAVASQAAIAIHNSRLADERAAVERNATTARIAVDLMHDVGKDLGWMRGLANRLAERTAGDVRLHRGAVQVGELAEALVERMKIFVKDASAKKEDPPGIARVDELIERSLRNLIARFGPRRIQVSHDPTVRRIHCHENVGRALFNLVDNAIEASGPDDPVRISATMNQDGWLLISVVDNGCGIPPGLISHAMEPGFTTRGSKGGLGVGLSLSRDMTEALGGKLELFLPPEGGVRAELRVPIPESWRTD